MANQSFDLPINVPVYTYTSTKSNGVLVTSNIPSIVTVGRDIKNSVDLPGYQDLILKGIDATTPYVREETRVIPGVVSSHSLQKWGGHDVDSYRRQTFAGYALPTKTYNLADLINEASNRLKSKLRQEVGSSNQLVNLVELRELPRTIKVAANSALTLLDAVASSKRRGENLRKWASNQWLNWSFGIAPTLSAIDELSSSIAKRLERDFTHKDYGVAKREWLESRTGVAQGSHHTIYRFFGQFKYTASVKITACYRFNLTSANNYTAGKHFGFDISKVVPTAWELVPFSWLVDYFTTTGQFLDDTFSSDPGQAKYIVQNTKLKIEGSITPRVEKQFPLTAIVSQVIKPAKYEHYRFTRSPLTKLPRAQLRIKTADEVGKNAVNKLLNLASILGTKSYSRG